MDKKFWIAFLMVFAVMTIWEFTINGVVLTADYAESAALWRPLEEMKTGLILVVYLCVAFFFTLIFSRGYEGRGVQEGIRYGFFAGMMMAVPMAYGSYAAMPIPYPLALKWFIFGLLKYVLLGALLALAYGRQATVTRLRGS